MSAGAAVSTALFIMRLAPELRAAVEALVRALLTGDSDAERHALEAARRAAFIARQRR
jgi:hypothetical protein